MKTKKLNGWLRIWIVLSVVWVGFIGFNKGPEIWHYNDKVTEVYPDEKNGEVYVYTHLRGYRSPLDLIEFVSAEDGTIYIDSYEEDLEKYRHELIEFFAVVLVPILGLLISGYTLAWVISGFRNPKGEKYDLQ